MKLESSIQLSSEDTLLKEIRDLKADLTKAKSDISELKARKLTIVTLSNEAQASGSAIVNCGSGGALLTCTNNSQATGSNVKKTTVSSARQCICNVRDATVIGGGNIIQKVCFILI